MRRAALAGILLAAGACGHEGRSLSGVDKVAPPGMSASHDHGDGADPHGAGGADPHASDAHGSDPHAGVPAATPEPHAAAPARPAAASRGPLAWTVPQGWTESPPSSGMRMAQFDVGSGVQCVVFQGISGDDEQNIGRWVDQMGAGAKDGAKTTRADHDGLTITRLEVRGAFTDTMRPGGAQKVDAATMLAAVVDTPGGKLHVKCVGPSSVVDAAMPQFDAFLASMKPR